MSRHAIRHRERHSGCVLLIKWVKTSNNLDSILAQRIQTDVLDDVMIDAKWLQVSHKVKRCSCNRPYDVSEDIYCNYRIYGFLQSKGGGGAGGGDEEGVWRQSKRVCDYGHVLSPMTSPPMTSHSGRLVTTPWWWWDRGWAHLLRPLVSSAIGCCLRTVALNTTEQLQQLQQQLATTTTTISQVGKVLAEQCGPEGGADL